MTQNKMTNSHDQAMEHLKGQTAFQILTCAPVSALVLKAAMSLIEVGDGKFVFQSIGLQTNGEPFALFALHDHIAEINEDGEIRYETLTAPDVVLSLNIRATGEIELSSKMSERAVLRALDKVREMIQK